ncbi:MAG: hypothetical protein ACREPL_09315 [Rhodanobacteraceae bacterium]
MILETLEKHRGFALRDLLPAKTTHADRNALDRALCRLEDSHRVDVRRWANGCTPLGRCAVMRRGERAYYSELESAHKDLTGADLPHGWSYDTEGEKRWRDTWHLR